MSLSMCPSVLLFITNLIVEMVSSFVLLLIYPSMLLCIVSLFNCEMVSFFVLLFT